VSLVGKKRKTAPFFHAEAVRLRLRAAAEGLLGEGTVDEGDEVETVGDEPYRLN
jgi:hypothetical protein